MAESRSQQPRRRRPQRVSLAHPAEHGADCVLCPRQIEVGERVVMIEWSDGDRSMVHEECAR